MGATQSEPEAAHRQRCWFQREPFNNEVEYPPVLKTSLATLHLRLFILVELASVNKEQSGQLDQNVDKT